MPQDFFTRRSPFNPAPVTIPSASNQQRWNDEEDDEDGESWYQKHRPQPQQQSVEPVPPPEPEPRGREATTTESIIAGGMRTLPALAGGMMGGGVTPAALALGAGGAAAGEGLAQWYERKKGIRKEYNPAQIGVQGAIGAVPFLGKFPGAGATWGQVGKYAGRAALEGGVVNAAATVPTQLAETGTLPSVEQVGQAGLIGAGFGGLVGGGFASYPKIRTKGIDPSALPADPNVPVVPPATVTPEMAGAVPPVIAPGPPKVRKTAKQKKVNVAPAIAPPPIVEQPPLPPVQAAPTLPQVDTSVIPPNAPIAREVQLPPVAPIAQQPIVQPPPVVKPPVVQAAPVPTQPQPKPIAATPEQIKAARESVPPIGKISADRKIGWTEAERIHHKMVADAIEKATSTPAPKPVVVPKVEAKPVVPKVETPVVPEVKVPEVTEPPPIAPTPVVKPRQKSAIPEATPVLRGEIWEPKATDTPEIAAKRKTVADIVAKDEVTEAEINHAVKLTDELEAHDTGKPVVDTSVIPPTEKPLTSVAKASKAKKEKAAKKAKGVATGTLREPKPIDVNSDVAPDMGSPGTAERLGYVAWAHGKSVREKVAKLARIKGMAPEAVDWNRDWGNGTKVKSIADAEAEIEFFKGKQAEATSSYNTAIETYKKHVTEHNAKIKAEKALEAEKSSSGLPEVDTSVVPKTAVAELPKVEAPKPRLVPKKQEEPFKLEGPGAMLGRLVREEKGESDEVTAWRNLKSLFGWGAKAESPSTSPVKGEALPEVDTSVVPKEVEDAVSKIMKAEEPVTPKAETPKAQTPPPPPPPPPVTPPVTPAAATPPPNQPKTPKKKKGVPAATIVGEIGNLNYRKFMNDNPVFKTIMDKMIKVRSAGEAIGKGLRTQFSNLKGLTKADVVKFQQELAAGKHDAVRKFFDDTFNDLKARGIDIEHKDNYLPQFWEESPAKVRAVLGKAMSGKASFQYQSFIKDYAEGVSKGLTPKMSPLEMIEWYGKRANKLIADHEALKALRAKGYMKGGKRRPSGMVAMDPNLGSFRDKWADPNIKAVIENYLGSAEQPGHGFGGKLAQAVGKMTNVALSSGLIPGRPLFTAHGLNMAMPWSGRAFMEGGWKRNLQAINFGLRPKMAAKYLEANNAKMVEYMKEFGAKFQVENVPGQTEKLFANETGAFGTGKAKEVANYLSEKQAKYFEKPLFENMIPAIKFMAFESNFEKNLAKGMSRADAGEAARKVSDSFYSGKNLDLMYNNRHFNTAARTLLAAPDWLRSTADLGINIPKSMVNILKDPKDPATKAYAKAGGRILAVYAAANMIQKATTGKFMFENSTADQFTLSMGKDAEGKKRRGLKLFGNAADMVKIPLQAAMATAKEGGGAEVLESALEGRGSPLVHAVMAAAKGEDYKGEPNIFTSRDRFGKSLKTSERLANTLSQGLGYGPPQLAAPYNYATGRATGEETISRVGEFPLKYGKKKKNPFITFPKSMAR